MNLLLSTRRRVFGTTGSNVETLAQGMFIGYKLYGNGHAIAIERQLQSVSIKCDEEQFDAAIELMLSSFKAYQDRWITVTGDDGEVANVAN